MVADPIVPNPAVTQAIDLAAGGENLSTDTAAAVLDEIMSGRVGEAQIAVFLSALRAMG